MARRNSSERGRGVTWRMPGDTPPQLFAHIADNSQEFDMVSSILYDAEVVELGVLPTTDAQANLARCVRTVCDRAHRH